LGIKGKRRRIMASPLYEIEGTWEEVSERAAEFAGRRVRVSVLPPEEGPAEQLREGPAEEHTFEEKLYLASYLLEQNRWSEARQAFMGLIENYPPHFEVLYRYGYACIQLQRYREGVNALNLALPLGGERPNLYRYLGYALTQLRRWPEAVEAYQRLHQIDEPSEDSLFYLGEAFLATGQYPEAVETLEEAVRRNPDRVWSRHKLAVAYEKVGNYEASYTMGKKNFKDIVRLCRQKKPTS
jgi:tetratricopeptide (TPR) repeat protein